MKFVTLCLLVTGLIVVNVVLTSCQKSGEGCNKSMPDEFNNPMGADRKKRDADNSDETEDYYTDEYHEISEKRKRRSAEEEKKDMHHLDKLKKSFNEQIEKLKAMSGKTKPEDVSDRKKRAANDEPKDDMKDESHADKMKGAASGFADKFKSMSGRKKRDVESFPSFPADPEEYSERRKRAADDEPNDDMKDESHADKMKDAVSGFADKFKSMSGRKKRDASSLSAFTSPQSESSVEFERKKRLVQYSIRDLIEEKYTIA